MVAEKVSNSFLYVMAKSNKFTHFFHRPCQCIFIGVCVCKKYFASHNMPVYLDHSLTFFICTVYHTYRLLCYYIYVVAEKYFTLKYLP